MDLTNEEQKILANNVLVLGVFFLLLSFVYFYLMHFFLPTIFSVITLFIFFVLGIWLTISGSLRRGKLKTQRK